jgi:hypothetical protein
MDKFFWAAATRRTLPGLPGRRRPSFWHFKSWSKKHTNAKANANTGFPSVKCWRSTDILRSLFCISTAFLPEFFWSSFGAPNRKPIEFQKKPKRTFVKNRSECGWIWIPEQTKRRSYRQQ